MMTALKLLCHKPPQMTKYPALADSSLYLILFQTHMHLPSVVTPINKCATEGTMDSLL